jgi:hypothetical protein
MSGEAMAKGYELFAQYAYPPNELGYCGPSNGDGPSELATHAKEFDGAWPYLGAIADAVGSSDPLNEDVVRSYWVGGRSLDKLDPAVLLARLRAAFEGQVTGLLDELTTPSGVLAHHSFHVFAVYPWVKFLDRDPTTSVRVMQDCRIRWGMVESVAGGQVVIASRPLRFAAGRLELGEPETEEVSWRKGDLSLAPAPAPGTKVSAHWDWVCGTLTDDEAIELGKATQTTLDLVNATFAQIHSVAATSAMSAREGQTTEHTDG